MSVDPFDALGARAGALVAVGRCREALPLITHALALRPKDPGASSKMAYCLLALGEPRQALRVVDEALSAQRHDELLEFRAVSLIRLRRVDEAIAAALEAVSLGADRFQNHLILAQALLVSRRDAEALAAADEACRRAPESRETALVRARALVALGRLGEAGQSGRALVAQAPDWASAHNQLGIVYWREGKRLAAAQAFLQALRLKPTDPAILGNIETVLLRARKVVLAVGLVLLFFAVSPFTAGMPILLWAAPGILLLALAAAISWKTRRIIPPEVRRALARDRQFGREWYLVAVIALAFFALVRARFSTDVPRLSLAQQARVKAEEFAACVYPTPGLGASIHASLVIASTGAVERASIDSSVPADMQRCILDRMDRWGFSPAPGRPQDVQFEIPVP